MFSPILYFIGETIGIDNTSASESGIFLACIPAASLIASSLILKKKPSKIQVTGIAITLAGVLITVLAAGASTVVSILAGVIFLQEKLSAEQIVGALIIVIGIYTANMKMKAKE